MEHWTPYIKAVFNRYHPIEDSTFHAIFSFGKVQNLTKGTPLLDVGNTSNHIHILLKGVIVSHYLSKDGLEYHKNIFLEGDFVGSTVSALKGEPSNFALTTIEDCILFTMDHRKYQNLISSRLDMKDFYIAYLEQNWVIQKEQREIAIVMQEASERYKGFIKMHPGIEARIPLHYIASHLGITPTQLSRIRKKIGN